MRRVACAFALLALLSPGVLFAAPLPAAAPEEVGVSSQRLQRLDAAMQQAVDSGELPGVVVMLARDGKLFYSRAFGWQDKAGGIAMREDSIFRIYSMTKPVVSAAAMMLVEEGRIGLHEPVSKYIPEFAQMQVGIDGSDANGHATLALAPAKRQMTVQDLLRHTSGLTYGAFVQRTGVQRAYKEAGLWSQKWVLADFARALAKLPLQYEPGTTWEYGHSSDILGRVVEVAAGQPLDRFFAQRIFKPLGMRDTAFDVAPGKHARIAEPMPDKYTGKTPELIDVRAPATFFAGGHGLASTAGDYLRFAQMLINGGQLDDARLLGPRTVQFMAADHLNDGISRGTHYIPGAGYGFGLGFATRLETGQSEWPGLPGEFFWAGYAGTYFWIDPQESLVAVLMSQEPVRRQHYRVLLRNLVYQAIID
jgi:CubicO group peptidase (beta-lactamase class C family)